LRREKREKLEETPATPETSNHNKQRAKPLPGKIFLRNRDAESFARILPNPSEEALFHKIFAYWETSKNASKIIKFG